MDARSQLELLRKSPELNGYSRDVLVALVQAADWTRPDVVSTLKVGILEIADAAIRSWQRLADSQRCTPLTAVRNLIACADESELAVYSILLRYEAKKSASSLGDHLKEILSLLPSSDVELSVFKTLVLTDRRPALGAYSRILKPQPEQLFLARFWSAMGRSPVSRKSLAETFQVAAGGPLRAKGHACISTMAKIRCQFGWPPFVTESLLETLPTSVRRSALGEESLLTAKLRKQLKEDPYFHPDAPAVMARGAVLSNALKDIRNKDLVRESVVGLAVDKALFTSSLEQIRAALRASPTYWSAPTLGSSQLIHALRALPAVPEVLALRMLSVPASERYQLLLKADPDVARATLSLCPTAMIAEALVGATSRNARTRMLGILDDQSVRYGVLKKCFADRYFKPRVRYRDLLTEWFALGEPADLVRTVGIDNGVMPMFADASGGNEKFLAILRSTLNRLSPPIIFELLMPARRKRYESTSPAHAAELIQSMVETLCGKKSLDQWVNSKSFGSFVKWFPQAAPVVLKHRPSDWAFRMICESPAVWRLGEDVVHRLMRLKDSNRVFLWENFLESWSPRDRSVPLAFRRYLEGDPKRFSKAFRKAPRLFWTTALRRYPLRNLLDMAFRDPKLAADLEKSVSRDALRSEIPWIRKHWRKKPTLAAAYETAAAFSLADAGFLVGLGKQLQPPFEPESRGRAFDTYYRTYELPKKSGGKRIITVPEPALKRLQRRLLDHGFNEVPLHPAAMGFRKGRSIKDNAAQHTGKKVVANVDIHQFFPSTRYALILRACRKLCDGNISPRAARLVAEICSYAGALPTGAPTSPAIGNIVLRAADQSIGTVADKIGVTYTRYADDLTFSGNDSAVAVLPFVREVLAQLGYELDDKKTNLYRSGRRQLVTGLVVNEKPNIPRRVRRKLRAAVHARLSGREAYWHEQPISDSVLLGHIAFLHLTQPEEANRYRQHLKKVLPE